jgi:hypothetical protein
MWTISRRASIALAALLVAVVALAALAPAAAAEQMKWRAFAYVTKLDLAPVGDVEGHVKGPFTRRGLLLLDTGEVAVYANSGVLDQTKGRGSFDGEATATFDDGSSFTLAFRGTLVPGPGGKPPGVYAIDGQFLRGTGRFDGIAGQVKATGRLLTPFAGETKGDAYYESTAEYTLPRR